MKLQIKKVKCLRCAHEWYPRSPDVRRCPKCKSYYFDRLPSDRREVTPGERQRNKAPRLTRKPLPSGMGRSPRDYAILKTTLLEIAKELFCMGPGCPFCDEERHPFSNAAKKAQKALSEVKI